MNCWHCRTELIWGNDHDIDPDDYRGDEFSMVTILKYITQKRRLKMMTLNLPNKQVNAILVALDAEIEMQLGGRPVDWESFPEIAAMLMAYYTTRCKFEERTDDD
jgi:hypothetical protein